MPPKKNWKSAFPPDTATVAFLRGINVGGHRKIAMAELRKAFESLGCKNVRTVLASGNVVFEAPKAVRPLEPAIAAKLVKMFGVPVRVVLRSVRELQAIVASEPFKNVAPGPGVKLYVTFLSGKGPQRPAPPPGTPAKGFRIVRVTPGEVFSVLTLAPDGGTTDLMASLEKSFGDQVTTRNWNTVLKIVP